MENYQWICVEEINSVLLLEFPEELGLQVAAGIKTILFLPLLPLGLVQLGSLDKLSEDLAIVAQLKDLFYPYRYTSMLGLRMEQTDSSSTLNWPFLEKYSTCLEMNTKLVDTTQPLAAPDFTTLSFDQVMTDELLPIGSVHFPHPASQSFDALTQDGLHQVHGLDTGLFCEKNWNARPSDLFGGHSEDESILNTSTLIGRTMQRDGVNTVLVDKEHLTYVEEFDLFIDSITNSKYMDFSVADGVHKSMENSCLLGITNSEWMDDKSKSNGGSELISTFKEERPKVFGFSNIGSSLIMKENRELESCDFANSSCATGRCTNSCSMRCKVENLSNSGDSGPLSHNLSSFISDSEGFKSRPRTCQSRTSVHLAPKNIDEKESVYGFSRSCLKESHISYRQTKNKTPNKPRPRDRQLIQDRIRELRELIPNSSKCSVDALLQRTVDHMMFLRSVPIHANKLSQSTRPKVGEKDLKAQSTHAPQTRASQTCESAMFPLIIENLEQPDQMLVEMQCKSYRLFLEIAQAIKRLGLTILKGVLETRSEELWAHFIVEIPKGFHRVDIILPLMQLQQLKL